MTIPLQSPPQLRAGIIGTGFIGPVHVEALRRIGVPVTALCGSERARAVAERWGIPQVFTGYDYQGLVNSPDVDVVHITTPNRHHHAQVLADREEFGHQGRIAGDEGGPVAGQVGLLGQRVD